MEGKEKGRKEAVETNVVHFGLFDTKKSQSVLHLGTSYIILKVSKKNREGKQELLGLRKGEKITRKE